MYIITADVHVMDGAREEYRWKTFDILEQLAEEATEEVEGFLIVGDLTELKDRHSAALTNRMVGRILSLSGIAPVKILLGNHDFAADPMDAFFAFLGAYDYVSWIDSVTEDTINGKPALWLPNTKTPKKDWEGLDFSRYAYVFGHQATIGAKLSEGYSLTAGVDPALFDRVGENAFFGDIHIGQNMAKKLISIGAPARFKFGDQYDPRILILDRIGVTEVETGLVVKHKITVSSAEEIALQDFAVGDQVKVIVTLQDNDYDAFAVVKKATEKALTDNGQIVAAVEANVVTSAAALPLEETSAEGAGDAIEGFAKRENLPEATKRAGQAIITKVEGGL